jgi:hypothetical protein
MEEFKMDFKKNTKYFGTSGWGWLILIFVGLIFGASLMAVNGFFGFIILAVGVVGGILLKVKGGGIKDEDIDKICLGQIGNIKSVALNKLGVDEDQVSAAEPIIVSGYNFKEKDSDIHYKMGKDGTWRSSQYEVVVFFFSDSQVHSFKRTFSIVKDESFDETEEYFYRDIVSVATTQGQFQAMVGVAPGSLGKLNSQQAQRLTKTVKYEYFKLTTSGGTAIQATFRKQDSNTIERSVAAMRNLLKAKKQAMV